MRCGQATDPPCALLYREERRAVRARDGPAACALLCRVEARAVRARDGPAVCGACEEGHANGPAVGLGRSALRQPHGAALGFA